MKKHILVFTLTLFVIATIILTGCGGSPATTQSTSSTSLSTTVVNSTSASSTVPPVSTSAASTTTQATTSTTSNAADSSLADILSKMSSISSVKYDAVAVPPTGETITQKYWIKKNKMRIETNTGGMNAVSLIDTEKQTMINYMPAQNIAMKMDFSQAPKSGSDAAKSIQNSSPKIVGVETIDGNVCTVVEYTDQGSTTKVWLWQARGLPLKTEATTPMGKVTVTLKNISFENIDDSLFELPAGVTPMDISIPTNIPGR